MLNNAVCSIAVQDYANHEHFYEVIRYKLRSEGNHFFVKTFFVCFWFYSTGLFKRDFLTHWQNKKCLKEEWWLVLLTIVVSLASILPTNVLSGFAYDTKWLPHIYLPDSFSNDTKKSHINVYTTLFKPQIRLMKLGNCPNTLAKRLKVLAKRRLTRRLLIEKHIKYSEVVYRTSKKNWSLNSITQDTPLLEKRKEVKKKIEIYHFLTPLVLDHISDISIPLVLLLSPPQMFSLCSCPSPSRPLAGPEDLDTSSSFRCLCVSLFISST